MCELALSSQEENKNRKKMGFSSLLLSDLHFFCSFVLSHPLYFSYIIFFSPFIFKILSFLSPLFVTTTLLLLALLTTSASPETQPSFLFSFYSKLGSVLESKFDVNDEVFKSLEESMVVEDEGMETCSDEPIFVDKFCSHESTVTCEHHEKPVEIQPLKLEDPMDLEMEKCEKEEKKVKPKTKSEVDLDYGEGQYWKQPTKQESKAEKVEVVGDCNDVLKLSHFLGEEKKSEVREKEEDVALKSFGSMRKEKEWRRTLACKLFEERHNADVGQGMDQLWETYETETEKKQTEEEKQKQKLKKKKSVMMKTKSIEKEVDVEEEEGADQQQLCCLQALKFSTGKMHLGIAKPNLLKLTKAFKGFGRFYKHHKKA